MPEAVKEKMVLGIVLALNRTGAPRRKVHRGGNGDIFIIWGNVAPTRTMKKLVCNIYWETMHKVEGVCVSVCLFLFLYLAALMVLM